MPKNSQTTAQLHSSHTVVSNAKNSPVHEPPDVQAGSRKGRGTSYQIVKIHWIIKKAREFQKNICFIDYTTAFDCVDHSNCGKFLKRWEYQTT